MMDDDKIAGILKEGDGQGLTGSRYPTRPELFVKYPTRPVPKSKTPTRQTLETPYQNTKSQ